MPRILMLFFAFTVGVVGHAQSQAKAPALKPTAFPAQAAMAPAPARPAPQAAPAAPVPGVALTDEQKTIYTLGLLVQRSIKTFDLSPEELEILMRALVDGAAGKPAFALDEWGPKVEPLANARGVRLIARGKEAGKAYVDNAAAETGAVKTASGLVYRDVTVGTGRSPMARETVKVHYRGTLIDGTVFDNSYERNEPTTFVLAEVLPCWTEGVQRMKVGGKARLVCPSDLSYGDAGAPPAIPGGATLVFEVELLEVLPSPFAPRAN